MNHIACSNFKKKSHQKGNQLIPDIFYKERTTFPLQVHLLLFHLWRCFMMCFHHRF